MRRILDLRIVRWQFKLVYAVGVLAAGFAFGWLIRAVGAPELVAVPLTFVLDLAAVLLGARIFRGSGEAIEPPRAWWRMTARPPLSRNLGVILLVFLVMSVISVVFRLGASEVRDLEVVVTAEVAVFAALYLNSAIRLTRLGVPPKPPKPLKFRPALKL
ncbi:hypothetical protein [Agromyces subbeticus]|uniref:hypothetical protein n=1 Tax=Agromyces subbeticus TaxID=293890 RepID=UPI0003B5369C|nr:hypothetical protein [Agromyces subbeticus]